MRKLIVILLIITIGLFAKPLFVFTQDTTISDIDELNKRISEKREKIQKLEESIAQVKKDIDKKKLEAVSLKNQLSILDNRITQVELDIEATQEKLDTLNLEIEALEMGIGMKENTISRQKEMLAEFIRTINYEKDKDYLEILAAYDNFSDFYNRIQHLQFIEKDLGASAKSLRIAKTELEDKKSQTEERKQSYEGLKQDLEEKKKDFNEQVFDKENLLFQTKSSEGTYQTLLSNLRKQYQQIEQEIASTEREVREKLSAQEKLQKAQDANYNGLFSWPTQSRYVTAYFHDPEYPFRNVFEHNAIDIRAGQGTAVKAASSGYVARAKTCTKSSCYAYVMLIHSNGLSTVYGHLSTITILEDQFVTRGDIIGYSGGTPGTVGAGPFVTGPHLHFEVRKNGIPVNPLDYLVKDWE